MMMKFILTLFVSSTMSLNAFSQDPKHVPSQDSSAVRRQTSEAIPFSHPRLFELPPPLNVDSQWFPGFLRQSLASPLPSLLWESRQDFGIASAWKNEVLKQEEYKTLKTILGSIQAGGAAYLAYRYVKKYGLK